MIDQGAGIIFATSDDMGDGIIEAAAMHPDVPMVFASGDTALETGERYKPELTNLANIMGKMEYGQLIAGCAAAIKSKDGRICTDLHSKKEAMQDYFKDLFGTFLYGLFKSGPIKK